MNKKLITSSILTVALALPMLVLAFNPGPLPNPAPGLNINELVDVVFNILWPIAVAFFIIMFVLAAFIFISGQGEPAKIQQARQAVIWGVVGVVVALLAWSIPFIVRNQLAQ